MSEFSTTRQIAGILFADIEGYSQIGEDKLQVELQRFFAEFERRYLDGAKLLFQKNLGDGLLLCSTAPTILIEIALRLRDACRTEDWRRRGFGDDLRIRIGVHVDEVEVLDKNGEAINVVGQNVNRAARIEPVVQGNSVWCSESVQVLVKASNVTNYQLRPLGKRKLAKEFGEFELYEALWTFEATRSEPTIEPPGGGHGVDVGSQPIRIRRDFTDKQRRDYSRKHYEEIVDIFERKLKDLADSQEIVETDSERVTPVEFASRIYVDGERRTQCRLKYGTDWADDGISYGESDTPESFNEFLVPKDDGFSIYLKPSMRMGYGDTPERLNSGEEAADYLWEQFVRTLSY